MEDKEAEQSNNKIAMTVGTVLFTLCTLTIGWMVKVASDGKKEDDRSRGL